VIAAVMPMAEQDPRAVLSARGLRRDFHGFVAVNNVDLDVYPGQIQALIGPNGAGKTTVFNLLTKFLPPSAGRIEFLGQDITTAPPAKVARMGLGRSFQISAIFPHLSVLDNVRVALQRPQGLHVQFWRSLSTLDKLTPRAEQLLHSVGLDDARDRMAGDLSYGRKRVLEIATTLALDPKVLLLDEPTAGMGPEERWQMIETVQALWRAVHMTLIFIEHDMDIVFKVAETVRVLSYGAVLAEGTPDEIRRNPAVIEAYLGKAAGGAGAGAPA
jgi:branched-chain amino acid transport system ATP-binding protein